MKKILCIKCNLKYAPCNFKKHNVSCSGNPSWVKRQHDNIPHKGKSPNKIEDYKWIDIQNYYDNNHTFMETCTKFSISTHLLSKAVKLGIFKSRSRYLTAFKRGSLSNNKFFDPKERSRRAHKNNFGGYRKNAGRSKKFNYLDSFGTEVTLQSSYELRCAEILDSMGIRWSRPNSLKYDQKRYFPDFLLVDYGIYLDPKNDYLAKIDKPKINSVREQNNVIVHILTKNMLNTETISNLIKHVCPELVKGPG